MNIDVLSSECSSGCESGWTLYFEQSMIPPYPSHIQPIGNHLVDAKGAFAHQSGEEEEEDLSMVSDASSGPPHFHKDEYCGNEDKAGCFYKAPVDATFPQNSSSSRRQRSKEHQRRGIQEQQQNSFLDDTASSPSYNFPNTNFPLTSNQASINNISDFSHGYSTNHFESSSAYPDHCNFFQSTQSQNQLQENQWFGEKWMGMR